MQLTLPVIAAVLTAAAPIRRCSSPPLPPAPQPRLVLFSDDARVVDHWPMIVKGAELWLPYGFTVAEPTQLPPNHTIDQASRCPRTWIDRDCDFFVYIRIVDNGPMGAAHLAAHTVDLRYDLVGTNWTLVAAHEIGHLLLGEEHLPSGQRGLMSAEGLEWPTDSDRSFVCDQVGICVD